MSRRKRLSKVYAELSAQERSDLVLQAWKDGTPEDPEIRASMPPWQAAEFHGYMKSMNSANRYLGPFLLYISAMVGQLTLRLGWLASIDVFQRLSAARSVEAIRVLGEPITASEHEDLVDQERRRLVSIDVCAELLASKERARVELNDDEWSRVVEAKRRVIETLVSEQVLSGTEGESEVQVTIGSFYEWLGEPVPLHPEWASHYDVHSDKSADVVKEFREGFEAAREVARYLARVGYGEADKDEFTIADEWRTNLEANTRKGLQNCWPRMRAVEEVVQELAHQLGGTDPLIPELREALDATRDELARLRDLFGKGNDPLELSEPDAAALRVMRRLAQMDANSTPTPSGS